MSLLLAPAELEALTGLKLPSAQRRWLRANGVRFWVRADGRPAVPRSQIDGTREQERRAEPRLEGGPWQAGDGRG